MWYKVVAFQVENKKMLLFISIIAVGMTLSESDAGEVIFDFDSVEF